MAAHVMTGAVALRVFAGDIRALGTRLLSAGVRVGAAQLASQHRRGETAAPSKGTDVLPLERD
ncbi:hypothetical protein [Actinacidiphila glaucinigra]|uniref:Uncharacterized protein n=1 Tax=Actinacidiphila glaucinigra TaxID=235986 RepID=A0A239NHH0_9ACTN|nr:hypothetical protein [Actinacidiphila glaucinigra]SNT53569.1 hypothetical protein SAMN05216252_13550 [Actinacidiphila glaucinigra]